MDGLGAIKINDDEVGTFDLDEQERMSFKFDRGSAGIKDTLEYAAEQGFTVTLELRPEFESDEENK